MITDKQKKVMAALKDPLVWTPSLRKINEKTGIKSTTIHHIVKKVIHGFTINIEFKSMDEFIEEDDND